MSIQKIIAYYFIFIAIGMFGGGGIVAIEMVAGDILTELIFAAVAIIGVTGLLVNVKKLAIAEKKIKEMKE